MARSLASGHKAAGRYRLESPLGTGVSRSVWRATDETLERQVAVRYFDAGLDRTLLMEHAAIAASLTHPRVVRIFDSGFDDGRFFTVCELLPGSLAWARLPLAPDDAVRLGAEVAEALAYAHARSVAHGALHAGNVLMGEQGAKVADFAMSSSVFDAQPRKATTRDDLVQLGNLLYEVLTGRGRGGSSFRPLPDEPRGLAAVVSGLREGRYHDARRALADLRAFLPLAGEESARRRGSALLAAAVVTIAAVAAAGLLLLRREGGVGEPVSPDVAYRVVRVADYDPLGDGRESAASVDRAIDGNLQTYWRTERYRSGPNFSGNKPGVGLIVDLGVPRAVGRVRVVLAVRGCSYEIRTAPSRAGDLRAWRVVAQQSSARATTDTPVRSDESRWWLLWITRLTRGVPGAGSAYACAVSDVLLYPS